MPTVSFTVSLPPSTLSPNSRAHWATRHRDADEYQQAVWLAGRGCVAEATGSPWQRAQLELVQYAVRPRDHDNFLASAKPLIDVLHLSGRRSLGLLVDDSPEHLSITVASVRVKRMVDQQVVVKLRRVE